MSDEFKQIVIMIHEDVKDLKADNKDIRATLASVDKTLAINTASLEEHHRRTTISEARLDFVEKNVMFGMNVIKFVIVMTGLVFGFVKSANMFPASYVAKILDLLFK